MARYQTDSPVVKAALGVYIGYMQGSIALTRVAEGLSELNLTPKLFGRTAMIAHQIMKGETVDLTDGAVPDDFPSFTFQSVAAAGTVLALCEFPEDEIKSSGREDNVGIIVGWSSWLRVWSCPSSGADSTVRSRVASPWSPDSRRWSRWGTRRPRVFSASPPGTAAPTGSSCG